MIKFERFTLKNGLRVLFHQDVTTPMAVVNTLYDVGARDESEEKTGFAHLFEHLMFGGSINIPDFDAPLQNAGGESNAFTSNDLTNYYDVVPKENIETALWLESDRMLSLAFTPRSLEVQRNVVIEEFKQRYLNQPYGDVWLELRPLAYEEHPYKWATIGKNIQHIEEAVMEDVRNFFHKHYHPANAILCVAGNFELDEVKQLVDKYYGDIPSREKHIRLLTKEPEQTIFKEKTIYRDVPADAFYFAFKMPERKNPEYYIVDALSDALGREKSSRLFVELKKEKQLCSEIQAYITGNIDEGLLVISGKLNKGVDFKVFENALWECILGFCHSTMSEDEMIKLVNKIRTSKEFQEQGLLNRAMNLCFFELLGDANGINEELEIYQKITVSHIQELAKSILKPTNCSLLRVISEKKESNG
jgi:zinc protease|tara:strand:+ start:4107 stop:5360 length:1254 start_codon:yes stop_codon:yes gene_type:complete